MPTLFRCPAPPVDCPPAEQDIGGQLDAAPRPTTTRTCSACFLTEARLRETGLLGCARCYETFAPIIAAAVAVLHGVRVADAVAAPPASRSVTTPWPTRRAVPITQSSKRCFEQ